MRIASVAFFVFTAVALLAAVAAAQDKPIKPGPEHEMLKQLAGTWDAACKAYVDPSKPPVECKFAMTSKMDGGRWLLSDTHTIFLGAPYYGHGITGYDPLKKKFVGAWVDTMSPDLMTLEGEFDKTGKVLTLSGETVGPDGKPMKVTLVTTIKDKDHYEFVQTACGPDGKEFPMASISYTRKK